MHYSQKLMVLQDRARKAAAAEYRRTGKRNDLHDIADALSYLSRSLSVPFFTDKFLYDAHCEQRARA